jgi:drug/metabolite transporter (DMT)-like permease
VHRARLLVLLSALIFSTGGAAIKSVGLNGWQTGGLRAGIAAMAILAFLPQARRLWDLRVFLAGIAYAVMGISFVTANKYTTAANAIFLQDTAPLYMMFIGPWLLKEPAERRDWWSLALMAAGTALFFAGDQTGTRTAPDPVRGNLIAMISAIAWTASIAALRWMEKHGAEGAGMSAVAMGNLLACVCTLPFMMPLPAPASKDIAVLCYLGLIQIAFGYWVFTRGVRHTNAVEASLVMMAEPVFSPFWAFLVHGETPAPWSIAGGVLIIGAMSWRVLAR